jgi:hypothetical protein
MVLGQITSIALPWVTSFPGEPLGILWSSPPLLADDVWADFAGRPRMAHNCAARALCGFVAGDGRLDVG